MKHTRPFGIVILASLAGLSCGHSTPEAQAAATPPAPPVHTLLRLEPHAVGSTVRLPGVLTPFQIVQIFPKVNGFVRTVDVDRGSEVREGTVLLKMDAPEMEDKIASARLRYVEAHANYLASKDRFSRLRVISRTPGTVSAYDLEAAGDKMTADSALEQGTLAEYKTQQDLYNYLTVTAPFAGIISERNVHPGALVGPGAEGGKPMLVLQEQARLRLIVNIPEQYTAQVRPGETVHYSINALPGADFKATIARAAGALNDGYRSETMELDVPNQRGDIKPGMYAEVTLPVSGNAHAFIVPKSAVVTTTERKYVVAAEGGVARWIDVTLGNDDGDSTEVFGALREGQDVLSSADYTIRDGSHLSTK